MRTTRHPPIDQRLSLSGRGCPCHPDQKSRVRSRLAAFNRRAGELFWRVATNRYVFYGSLLLTASLVVGAITREHEELWRTATALGIATIVIGLVHAWLDTRADRKIRRVSSSSTDGDSDC